MTLLLKIAFSGFVATGDIVFHENILFEFSSFGRILLHKYMLIFILQVKNKKQKYISNLSFIVTAIK